MKAIAKTKAQQSARFWFYVCFSRLCSRCTVVAWLGAQRCRCECLGDRLSFNARRNATRFWLALYLLTSAERLTNLRALSRRGTWPRFIGKSDNYFTNVSPRLARLDALPRFKN